MTTWRRLLTLCAVDFTGTWTGTATEDKGGGPCAPTFTIVLARSGTTITGTFVDAITPTCALPRR
jgi:hypothetical protein